MKHSADGTIIASPQTSRLIRLMVAVLVFAFPTIGWAGTDPLSAPEQPPVTPITPITSPLLPHPTLPPGLNQAPELTVQTLAPGRRGEPYQTTVSGFDYDLTDTLTLTAIGLPADLSISDCVTTQAEDRLILTCSITGIPLQAGTFPVTLTLTDNHGGSDELTTPIRIFR